LSDLKNQSSPWPGVPSGKNFETPPEKKCPQSSNFVTSLLDWGHFFQGVSFFFGAHLFIFARSHYIFFKAIFLAAGGPVFHLGPENFALEPVLLGAPTI
jgi:hypothetical protein